MRGPYRRGLTLIEVLAAAVLLAMFSGVCASLMRDFSASVLEIGRQAAFHTLELERFADDALADHSDLAPRDASDVIDTTLAWPDEPGRCPVRVRSVVFQSAAKEPAHAWLAFSCDGRVVWRYVILRKEGEKSP